MRHTNKGVLPSWYFIKKQIDDIKIVHIINHSYELVVSGLPKSFSYYLSGATQTPYNCGSGNTVKYATHPYANYVESFYNENTLSTVYTPTQAEFYTFRTNPATSPAEPFSTAPTQTIVSAKFNTSGVKISGDANTCSDLYARWCNSTTTCVHPYVQSYV